jgi:hypothetical protein
MIFYLFIYLFIIVSYPGKGECADPVYEDAILEGVGGEPPGRDKERCKSEKWELTIYLQKPVAL